MKYLQLEKNDESIVAQMMKPATVLFLWLGIVPLHGDVGHMGTEVM